MEEYDMFLEEEPKPTLLERIQAKDYVTKAIAGLALMAALVAGYSGVQANQRADHLEQQVQSIQADMKISQDVSKNQNAAFFVFRQQIQDTEGKWVTMPGYTISNSVPEGSSSTRYLLLEVENKTDNVQQAAFLLQKKQMDLGPSNPDQEELPKYVLCDAYTASQYLSTNYYNIRAFQSTDQEEVRYDSEYDGYLISNPGLGRRDGEVLLQNGEIHSVGSTISKAIADTYQVGDGIGMFDDMMIGDFVPENEGKVR